jgi:hypothetical protein
MYKNIKNEYQIARQIKKIFFYAIFLYQNF